jgi:hypothetical protein
MLAFSRVALFSLFKSIAISKLLKVKAKKTFPVETYIVTGINPSYTHRKAKNVF